MSKSKKQMKESKSGSSFFWIVVVIAVCLLALIIFLGNKSNNPPKDTVSGIDYSSQPFEGDKNAPVKIIEFGDYKCPICKDFNEIVYPVIQKELVDTGKAKFYFVNFPFINTDSTRSAQFAETVYKELGSDKYWKFHHLLYKNQPKDEYEDYFTESVLKDTLAKVANDKDVKKVVKAFQNKEYKKAMSKDESLVKDLNIQSTPTLFINGKQFKGKTYDEFIAQVKEEAAK